MVHDFRCFILTIHPASGIMKILPGIIIYSNLTVFKSFPNNAILPLKKPPQKTKAKSPKIY